jgi:ppGpp synthetase/RelA/SpoT-type nucleotidyltranferase
MVTLEYKKPENVDEFKRLIRENKEKITTKGFESEFIKAYGINTDTILNNVNEKIWSPIKKILANTDDLYQKNNDLDLLANIDKIHLEIKPIDSVINKAFRISVRESKHNYGEKEYFNEFVTPENMYEKLNDIIRTEITVKYIDGIDLIIDAISIFAKDNKYKIYIKNKSDEVGYYAKHVYLTFNSVIVDYDYKPKNEAITFEIQIRTQLQDTVRKILHKYYEKDRIKNVNSSKDSSWKWQISEPRFITNYVGHILHFLDGIIMRIKSEKEA